MAENRPPVFADAPLGRKWAGAFDAHFSGKRRHVHAVLVRASYDADDRPSVSASDADPLLAKVVFTSRANVAWENAGEPGRNHVLKLFLQTLRGQTPVRIRSHSMEITQMMRKALSANLQQWVDARQRFRLSDAHVQMARELGLNPRKLGKLDNHRQEPWKAPLPRFIEHLYVKRFGREGPEVVMSVEEKAREMAAKKAARRDAD